MLVAASTVGLPEDYEPPLGSVLIAPVRDPDIVFGSDDESDFVRRPDRLTLHLKPHPRRGGGGVTSFRSHFATAEDGATHRVGRIKIRFFEGSRHYLVRITALAKSSSDLRDGKTATDLSTLIPLLSEFYIRQDNALREDNFHFQDELLRPELPLIPFREYQKVLRDCANDPTVVEAVEHWQQVRDAYRAGVSDPHRGVFAMPQDQRDAYNQVGLVARKALQREASASLLSRMDWERREAFSFLASEIATIDMQREQAGEAPLSEDPTAVRQKIGSYFRHGDLEERAGILF